MEQLLEGILKDCPWLSQPPKGQDKWIQTESFVIRCHGKYRTRAFHPLHRSFPGPVARLTELRVTIAFGVSEQATHVDHWRVGGCSLPWTTCEQQWRGYTVFQLEAACKARDTEPPEPCLAPAIPANPQSGGSSAKPTSSAVTIDVAAALNKPTAAQTVRKLLSAADDVLAKSQAEAPVKEAESDGSFELVS